MGPLGLHSDPRLPRFLSSILWGRMGDVGVSNSMVSFRSTSIVPQIDRNDADLGTKHLGSWTL